MIRGRRALDELDDDIRDHLDRQTQDNIDRGLTPAEARRRALLAFGNVALVKEDTRAVWMWRWLEELRAGRPLGARGCCAATPDSPPSSS